MFRPIKSLKKLGAKFSRAKKPEIVSWETKHMNASQGKRSFLAISKSDPFIQKNKVLFLSALRLFRRQYSNLKQGKTILDPKTGISIKIDATGRYLGNVRRLPLRVNIAGKDFFVKWFRKETGWRMIKGCEEVERFLAKRGNKFEGINVRVISPHIVYEKFASEKPFKLKEGFFVTDFYPEGQVMQVADLPAKIWTRVDPVLTSLGSEVFRELEVEGIHSTNSFYDQKTNTILLYDLNYFKP